MWRGRQQRCRFVHSVVSLITFLQHQVHTYIHTSRYIHTYRHTHTHTNKHTRGRARARTYTHTHTNKYTRARTHTHPCTCPLFLPISLQTLVVTIRTTCCNKEILPVSVHYICDYQNKQQLLLYTALTGLSLCVSAKSHYTRLSYYECPKY